MSRFEFHRLPLHHAVHINRPKMVRLLLELGADPNAKDDADTTPLAFANNDCDSDIIEALTEAGTELGLVEAMTAKRWQTAERIVASNPSLIRAGGKEAGAIVLMAIKRNPPAIRWLVDHGCDINAKANYWECNATALHFVIEQGSLEMIRFLLEAGADPNIEDDKYHSNAFGWADHFGRKDIREILDAHQSS